MPNLIQQWGWITSSHNVVSYDPNPLPLNPLYTEGFFHLDTIDFGRLIVSIKGTKLKFPNLDVFFILAYGVDLDEIVTFCGISFGYSLFAKIPFYQFPK